MNALAKFGALLIVLAFLSGEAQAKWKPQYEHADPKVVQWFSTQHNKTGGWCCDQSDGHEYDGNYTLLKDGGVDIDFGYGEHFLLSADKVLDGPNPTGHAVWWYVDRTNGEHEDYCFAPGAGG